MDKLNTPGTTGHVYDIVYQRLKQVVAEITAEEWQAKINKVIGEENQYAIYDKIDPPPPPVQPLNDEDIIENFDVEAVEAQQPEVEQAQNIIVVTPIEPFKCPQPNCTFETLYEVNLQQHVKATYNCDQCSKTFHGRNAAAYYESHSKSHAPKPQVQPRPKVACDVCGRTFKYKSQVTHHKLKGPCGRQ